MPIGRRSVRTARRGAFLLAALAPLAACRVEKSASSSSDTTYHGVAVSDPYRWLEDGSSPHVKAWIDSQNVHTDSVINRFPQGAALSRRVAELATTSPVRYAPVVAGHSLYYFREAPPQPQPVLVRTPWPSGAEQLLVDVNKLPGSANIVAYWPSPTGRLVAYAVALGGSEQPTIHFLNAETGKPLSDTLAYAAGGIAPPALAWDADERGVTFERFPVPAAGEAVRQFDVSLYHHVLGSTGPDSAAFGQGYSHIAEFRLFTSDDGKQAAALANKGDGGPAEVYQRSSSGWRRVLGDTAGVIAAAYSDENLLVVATTGTPRGRIVSIAPNGEATKMLGERTWPIQSISPIAGGVLVVEDSGTRWRVEHYATSGALVRVVGLPASDIGVDEVASSSSANDAIVEWSGWKITPRWQRYDGVSGRLTTVQDVKSPADFSRVAIHTVDAISKDGTHVPVTVLAMQGTPQNGTAPALLTGYGGFDIPTGPHFAGPNIAWLERGGIIAYANIRGGNEFGETWHQGGMGIHKQNVFDDFYAAAHALVQQKWTSTDRLGIQGASNGGLLMGAELTQHPEAFRAVVSSVGIYDMIRHATFPNGAYNVTEYGDVGDSTQFAAIYAYSPLQHIRTGTAYPAVLLQTAVNDARVAPWQSRKFAASLEGATTSGHPVLLLTRTNAGHGVDAPFAQRVDQTSLAFTFFAHELGLKERDSTRDARKKVDLKRP
ncbi:MAG TPA: prolyl oligopeptidase family serine peptidase [Gemmatimonadaceae bacterium]|nr:prolyl oligopeptidase family serine peptidase [Gemmatimonadaceae bacterium]